MLSYKDKIKMIGLCYDAMQAYYNPAKDYYAKEISKTSFLLMRNILQFSTNMKDNPVYVLSCLFKYWTFINKNHKSKLIKILTPSSATKRFIYRAYLTNKKFDETYNDSPSIFHRDNAYISAVYAYFNHHDLSEESLTKWVNDMTTDFITIPEKDSNKEQLRKELLQRSKGQYHKAQLLYNGFTFFPGEIMLFDKEAYELNKLGFLTATGYAGLPDNQDKLDKYFVMWYDYATGNQVAGKLVSYDSG